MNRSYLFVPADSERKLAKASATGADALILDLEDAVAAEARPAARKLAAEFLQDTAAWVRINPIDGADAALDLAAIMPAGPAGIVLPKPRNVDEVELLATQLENCVLRPIAKLNGSLEQLQVGSSLRLGS